MLSRFLFPRFCCLAVLVCLLQTDGLCQSPQPVMYANARVLQPLSGHLWILEDPAGTYSARQALAHPGFRLDTNAIPNLGVSNAVFWVKFHIRNQTEAEHLMLKLAQPNIDDVTFYRLPPGRMPQPVKTGLNYPYRQRQHDSQHFLFDFKLGKGQTGTYLLRLQANTQLQVPLWVGSERSAYESAARQDLYMGLYVGIILAMLLYNSFLLASLRSRSYLLYVLNILVVGLTQVAFQGYAYRFLWPGSPLAAQHSVAVLSALSGITGLMFAKFFLRTHRFAPRLDKGLRFLVIPYLTVIVVSMSDYKALGYKLLQITAFVAASYVLTVAVRLYLKGNRTAGFFLLAWSVFLIGICVFVAKDFGVLPYNDFTANIMLIGSAAETVLLSFALADRISRLKQEREQSQQQMLAALRVNERLVQEENVRLERKVKERTRELEESAEELNAALSHLKATQGKLLHTEKMASLGQLTAGVAHEINNPINFVSASIKPLRRDVKYLWQLIARQEEALKAGQDTAQHIEMEAFRQQLDVEYLRDEIDRLLGGVEEGASRTAAIVRGLRNFSRLDDGELRPVSLEEGLDSTLLLLSHLLKDIRVQKDYALAQDVECYAGKLNQVFMNILGNAIQAIRLRKHPAGRGIISISTRLSGRQAVVCISDNGIGMTQETQSRMFDPFFTTKQVGEGTGLGLSIVFGIVEAHQGKLQVESAEGAGTQFTISLPLVYAVPQVAATPVPETQPGSPLTAH